MRRLALLLLTPFMLNGCVAAAVGAGTEAGISLAEERSIGRKVDDMTIYTDINRIFLRANSNDLFAGVTVNVRHARVLLTGNVAAEDTARQAVQLAWQARGVEEVINEITVNPGSGFSVAANDFAVKTNLESRLLLTKHVWVINYSIDVVNGTAYLLGRVTDQAELDRVIAVARTTKGVKRVVNYLQIRPQDDAPRPATSPYATPSAAPAAPAYGSSTGNVIVTDPVVVPSGGAQMPDSVSSNPL